MRPLLGFSIVMDGCFCPIMESADNMRALVNNNSFSRILDFARRARAYMLENNIKYAVKSCPWCNTSRALRIDCDLDGGPFSMTCGVDPKCFQYKDYERPS